MTGEPPADVSVAVDGVSKTFRLPHEQVHTLKERALHPFRKREIEELRALQDVSVDIKSGEFFGIVGRNGSGKTTLMKCLAGIYQTDSGEIWLRGRMAPFIELGVGFNPDLTARDNVLINAIMLGLSPTQARERYDDIIEFAELGRFVDLKLKNYSSGMQVRLAFAVMVHVDADLLLIDEVLAVGDGAFQRKCHDALVRARDEGRTILLVTHDMNAVQRYCHRAMLLDSGRVAAIGDPHMVARRYDEVNRAIYGTPVAAVGPGAGDGAAAISDAWIEDEDGKRVDTITQGRSCRMCMTVQFRAAVEDPLFGFSLTDERQRVVLSINSGRTHSRSGSFGSGDRARIAVAFDCVLADGNYFISPEVRHRDQERRLIDHRDNAATFVVSGGKPVAGILDLPHDVQIVRAEERAAAG
ncbi:MAG TPA: ABC transporter ATP-binding protein [Thermoleophilaceae bacterium]|jgi:ABC-type polysaccharide/polyol phosphate transport system ATPase subunit